MDDRLGTAVAELVIRGSARADHPLSADLVDAGFAAVIGDTVLATEQGAAAAAAALLVPADDSRRPVVSGLHEAFLPLNTRLKQLCSAWQVRPDGSPNDHSDIEYDLDVRDALDEVHEAIEGPLEALSSCTDHAAGITTALRAALHHLDAGENDWLTSVRVDSYHTVWMRLHQLLLLLLGIPREEEERRAAARQPAHRAPR